MTLNINDIQPLRGKMGCNLWENSHIGLPLSLFYSIEIPLKPFDSGHDYVSQPTETSIVLEWIRLADEESGTQTSKWPRLAGQKFCLSYGDETCEGSIYLGGEHCQFDAEISFISLNGLVFEIEMKMSIDFNIETINLRNDGFVQIKTQLDFTGLDFYDSQLPSFKPDANPFDIISGFLDLNSFDDAFIDCTNEYGSKWKRLKAKP